MKGYVSGWLWVASACLAGCGGNDGSDLTPVASTEMPPAFISYPDPNAFTQGVPITPLVPTITGGNPTTWVVEPPLPAGLRLDFQGRITGTPTSATAPTTYIVTAGNTAGTTSFGVRITVTGTYTVGGVVNGLTGTGLVLTNNGGDPLAIGANGPFTFPGAFTAGFEFLIEVATQPAGQTCGITGANGVITNSIYDDAVVTCSANVQKLASGASTLTDAVRTLGCADAELLESIRVVDTRTGSIRLLGDVVHEVEMRTRNGPRSACGQYTVTVAPSGAWVHVTDRVTRDVRAYPIAEAR